MYEREKNHFPEEQSQNLIFGGVVTSELFSLANYMDLTEGIEGLFHELQGRHPLLEVWKSECQQFIQKATGSLHARGYHKLPFMLTSDRVGKPGCIFFEPLPDSIRLLSLSLLSVLPSLMAVVAFCEFNAHVSNQLKEILHRRYEEERTKVGNLEAWTIHSPHQRRKEKARLYIFGIRRSVEEFISRYFRGIFLADGSCAEVPACPSVELFSLEEFPVENEKAIADWIEEKDNRIFLDALGCLPCEIYRGAGYLLIPPDTEYFSLTRKILGSMSYFASDKYEAMGFPEAKTAFFYAYEDLLKAMSAWFSLYELIDCKTHEITALREKSRTELSNILGVADISRLTRLFSREIMKGYTRFSEKRLWFQRFQSELNEESVSLANLLLFHEEFEKINLYPRHEDKKEFWFDSLVRLLRDLTTALQREIELLKEEFGIELSVARIQSNNVFISATKQWSTALIILTVVLVFLGLLSLVPWKGVDWSRGLSWLKLILGL